MTATVEYTRPWLYPKQLDAIFSLKRYSVCEASTKSGKTHGCMIWLMEQAMQGKPGWNYWWVAPVYPQADIAYRRLRRAIPRGLCEPNKTALTLTLANDTRIWFKTAEKPDNLFGEDVRAVVIDEASRVREESWQAVRTTLTATKGPIRIIGNVKGRKNWAYRLARKAEAGAPDMHYSKLTWHDAVEAGVLDIKEIEDARELLPEAVFKELYEADPADDEGNPFGVQHIRECVAPLSDNAPVVWGWDVAKSQDWTVGIGLDEQGRTCRFERFQHEPWPRVEARITSATGGTPAVVDATGVGDSTYDYLRQHGSNYIPFKFTSASKQEIMERLAKVIQGHDIRFPEGPIQDELETFEYEFTRGGVKYTAPEGLYDDCVCALALAVSHWSRPRGIVAIGGGEVAPSWTSMAG